MITGWDHMHVVCGDVDTAVKYFVEHFQGKETSRQELRGLPMVRVNVMGLDIAFIGTDPQSPLLQPGKGQRGLDHMGFKVQDLDTTLAELKAKGVTLNTAPGLTAAGIKYVFINGPEGIRIELIERK
jgi:catechol 2,3-dioxygenase-like lactoylglutathione lyase family enzyme